MSEFVKVGTLDELKTHGQFSRWIEDHDVLVYELNGSVRALSNICPHFGGPIGYHKMANRRFTCLWHNFQFAAEDGACLYPSNLKGLKLREYKVKVEGPDILVQLVERTA